MVVLMNVLIGGFMMVVGAGLGYLATLALVSPIYGEALAILCGVFALAFIIYGQHTARRV